MNSRLSSVVVAVATLASVFAQWATAAAEELTVEKTVILLRHGIRPPSSSERKLFEPITSEAWPVDLH